VQGSQALQDLPAPPVPASGAPLPLFASAASAEDDPDEPLIKLPATPRPPLAVRKTPDAPRLRAVPRPVRLKAVEPVLEFVEETAPEPVPEPAAARLPQVFNGEPGPPRARVMAAAIDQLILAGIDAAVVYLTMRLAGLELSQWGALPILPLGLFLLLLKFGYFAAFTAVGGQTIGKMASHLRVVSEQGTTLDAPAAIRRTLFGTLSAALLGAGFWPALLTADGRALHDRMAGTRVIQASA
jgi:uncharacterized RDD family membrane protein YckC